MPSPLTPKTNSFAGRAVSRSRPAYTSHNGPVATAETYGLTNRRYLKCTSPELGGPFEFGRPLFPGISARRSIVGRESSPWRQSIFRQRGPNESIAFRGNRSVVVNAALRRCNAVSKSARENSRAVPPRQGRSASEPRPGASRPVRPKPGNPANLAAYEKYVPMKNSCRSDQRIHVGRDAKFPFSRERRYRQRDPFCRIPRIKKTGGRACQTV